MSCHESRRDGWGIHRPRSQSSQRRYQYVALRMARRLTFIHPDAHDCTMTCKPDSSLNRGQFFADTLQRPRLNFQTTPLRRTGNALGQGAFQRSTRGRVQILRLIRHLRVSTRQEPWVRFCTITARRAQAALGRHFSCVDFCCRGAWAVFCAQMQALHRIALITRDSSGASGHCAASVCLLFIHHL